MDEQRVEFAAFDQIERSDLFEFVAQMKPIDEQISQRQREIDASTFDDALELEHVQVVGDNQRMQLALNESILFVVVDRMLGERVPVAIVVVVLQKQPGLADEENLLGEWKRDVRRKHVGDQLVLTVGRRRRGCRVYLQCAVPVSIGRVRPAGHGGRETRDARCGQAHGVDVDVIVQADEELAVFVVDLTARENRCHLLDENSMA